MNDGPMNEGPVDDGPVNDGRARGSPGADRADAALPVLFRPHHFLCALGFQGKGYSPAFTANMHAIVEGRLRAEDGAATPMQVVAQLDDICAPCPKRRGEVCASQTGIARLDAAHAAALALTPGMRLTWGQALDRIRERVRPGDLPAICAGCEWLPLGMCEGALAALHDAHR